MEKFFNRRPKPALHPRIQAGICRSCAKTIDGAPGFTSGDISHVITASCTGFYSPGPDHCIVWELKLSPSVERFHLGFMGCYAAFPAIRMADNIRRALLPVLERAGWPQEAIGFWAVHPGGKAILDRVSGALELPDDALDCSRDVLRRYGNMSSATLFFLLREGLSMHPPKIRTAAMAIGITPPSLDILERLDLKRYFLAQGVLIPRARVFEQQRLCGLLDFSEPGNQILSLPQYHTLRLLRERLSSFESVQFHEGTEWNPGMTEGSSGWIVGCDGAKSTVRDHFNFPFVRKTYPVTFVMADFPDDEDIGSEARIYFSPDGAVESFPLPRRRRRWIAQVLSPASPNLDTLSERVDAACGVDLRSREHEASRVFTPERLLVRSCIKNNVLLCGDAAHVMSPIGGQGMNTGFADAAVWAQLLPDATPKQLIRASRVRRRAFRVASRRVATGMNLVIRTGGTWSRIRENLLRTALHRPSALNLESLQPFDYLFANHFLHHLTDSQVHRLLEDACRLARRGVVFSDLRRSRWSYRAFSLVARIYRNSFAREDGLLSIRKGFVPEDFRKHRSLTIRTRFPGRIQLLGGGSFK